MANNSEPPTPSKSASDPSMPHSQLQWHRTGGPDVTALTGSALPMPPPGSADDSSIHPKQDTKPLHIVGTIQLTGEEPPPPKQETKWWNVVVILLLLVLLASAIVELFIHQQFLFAVLLLLLMFGGLIFIGYSFQTFAWTGFGP